MDLEERFMGNEYSTERGRYKYLDKHGNAIETGKWVTFALYTVWKHVLSCCYTLLSMSHATFSVVFVWLKVQQLLKFSSVLWNHEWYLLIV